MSIVFKNELLQEIAAGVQRLKNNRIQHIRVIVESDSGGVFEFTLPQILDYLANDIYWDERGNWALAKIARVEVM